MRLQRWIGILFCHFYCKLLSTTGRGRKTRQRARKRKGFVRLDNLGFIFEYGNEWLFELLGL